ncbi:MAG: sigma-70 family RNA polymerase sigma factor [Flavitalea sp.]
MTSSQADIALWEAYKTGDREAFGLLFEKYYTALYQFGSKFTANQELLEDCIQELFAELWQRKSVTQVISVKAYLLKSLKYKIFRSLNKISVQVSQPLTDNMAFQIAHEDILITLEETKEQTDKVLNAMKSLTSRQKEIIYLQFYQELNYEEVSEIMNINYQAARNLLYQSIKALKKILGGLTILSFIIN